MFGLNLKGTLHVLTVIRWWGTRKTKDESQENIKVSQLFLSKTRVKITNPHQRTQNLILSAFIRGFIATLLRGHRIEYTQKPLESDSGAQEEPTDQRHGYEQI